MRKQPGLFPEAERFLAGVEAEDSGLENSGFGRFSAAFTRLCLLGPPFTRAHGPKKKSVSPVPRGLLPSGFSRQNAKELSELLRILNFANDAEWPRVSASVPRSK